ncbi:hypothetical protein L1787_02475 [Acuticoccus sp. M5D2P5]|uniref:hypothetical protein n=1 Tax=Acuticoccus kalidii TaxID=2910977 RepID=UPI001F44A0F6|nr:hypothetical protein [Acuticoccus kalidii]MCF3932281.1 hypothetical protein [Acuticoccus kalidii]
MLSRIVSAIVFVFVAVNGASAADLGAEPVSAPPEKRCNTFTNLWIFGDPTNCDGDQLAPACDAESVVSAAVRFANRAEDVYRLPRVTEFVPQGEVPQTVYNPSPLVRRYCMASATLDTGARTTAYYFLEEDAGFVGFGWKVYVCLDGYDSWRVYDGRCRVARPATAN